MNLLEESSLLRIQLYCCPVNVAREPFICYVSSMNNNRNFLISWITICWPRKAILH